MKVNMSSSYIFCQAPAKIPAVLCCYEKEVEAGNKVTIVTKNCASMSRFFRELELNATIVHLETIGFKPFLFHPYAFKKLIRKDIEDLGICKGADVRIFFTDICDYSTVFYLSELRHFPVMKIQMQNDIKLNMDRCWDRSDLPFRLRIKERLFSILFGYSFLYTRQDYWGWNLAINTKKYNYPLLDCSDMSVCGRYLVAAPCQFKHCVLFFTEPYRNKFQTEDDYMRLNRLIITELQKKGYKVGVKGHPRIGLPDGIRDLADFEVQSYLPAEFIDMKSYDFTIGFVSTSVSSASNQIPAYSVLPMCRVIDKNQVDYWYDYLNKLSANKVFYLNDWNDIPNVT